MWKKFRL